MSLIQNQNRFYRETGQDLRDAFTSFNGLNIPKASSLFDLKSPYGISELRDEVETEGSGSVTNARGMYTLPTATITSIFSIREEW